ncbi:hypothetical protein DGWBC_1423 [Dehalogenimonas sp. WBC-2]|nr:hypothetical protein DGWBC_1423 [Dehalogenimonas sp. WBC-2]
MDLHGGAAFPAPVRADVALVADGKSAASVALGACNIDQHALAPFAGLIDL